jgi:hypothetical protein
MNPHSPDVKMVYDHFARMAVNLFNDSGKFPPQLFAVYLNAAHTDFTDIAGVDPRITLEFFRDAERGGLLRFFVRNLLEMPGLIEDKTRVPNFVAQVNEAWRVQSATKEVDLPLSEHPEREEVILIMLHSLDATAMGTCPIKDTPQRHAEYEPLPEGTKVTGRMAMQARKVH